MLNIGVIPAAGRGIRLDPYTEKTPKVLLEVGGMTLIERNILLLKEQLGITRIIVILGHLGEEVMARCGNGDHFGVQLEYVFCDNVDAGLAQGLLSIRNRVDGHFIVVLGDELYLQSNHAQLRDRPLHDVDAICGYRLTGDLDQIKKNYSFDIVDGKISHLDEKPLRVSSNNLGLGTIILSPKIFSCIEQTPPSPKTHRVELIDAINRMAVQGNRVFPALISGEYRNINFATDFIAATHLYRQTHFHEYRISLVIPAYNEEGSLGFVIDEFKGLVDEIVVAASTSTDKTVAIAQEKADRVVTQTFLGYGEALRAGIEASTGEIIILVEADATFSPKDLPKLLSYLKDADMVIGTRTTKQMIQQGANMNGFIRWGNVLASKVLQVLWLSQEPRFTDLGCTYRAMWRDCYDVIKKNLSADGPEFSPEVMLETMRARRKIIEIPVTYRPRIGGKSSHSSSTLMVLKTGLKMLGLILRKTFFHRRQVP
jgi:NDP-sugar pyrophosphorylase family protein